MSQADQKRIDAFLRDGATSTDMMQMAVKSLGIRMRNIQVSAARKPEDKYVMPNPKTKMHQYQFQLALKQQNNPIMKPNRPSPGQKRKSGGQGKNGKNHNNNNKKNGRNGKNKGGKNGKNGNQNGKGRALDNNTETNENKCKLEIVPKYDFSKVPKGLKAIGDLEKDQKDLLQAQCHEEGLEIDVD